MKDVTQTTIQPREALQMHVYEKIADFCKKLITAEKQVVKTSETRRALPPGSPRRRITTANARWISACEARDCLEKDFREYLTENDYPF